LRNKQDEAFKYALGLGALDAFTVGAESTAEQNDVVRRIPAGGGDEPSMAMESHSRHFGRTRSFGAALLLRRGRPVFLIWESPFRLTDGLPRRHCA